MDNLTPWKEALKERTLYGCFVTYGLPDIAEVTALMGFDFLLLDNEHGGRAILKVCKGEITAVRLYRQARRNCCHVEVLQPGGSGLRHREAG